MSIIPSITLDLEQYYMVKNDHVADGYADEDSDWEDNTPLSPLGGPTVILQAAFVLKKGLELSMQDASDGEGDLCTEGGVRDNS